MREFTSSEKDLTNALIQNVSKDTGLRIGDVLLQVYPIEYIEKNKLDEPFYKETLKICHKVEENLESKLYEAFSLIIMLIEQRYMFAKDFIDKDIICKKNYLGYSFDNPHEEQTYFNYYNIDLWKLLNSHYSITNSLIDFAKDFKMPEQRRFEEQLKEAKKSTCWSRVAAIVAIITVLFTICHTCCNQQNNSQQIYSIINAIQEQKSISIEHFPNIIPDTLNVKLTDKTDNQPINLNVTVKPDQPKQIK